MNRLGALLAVVVGLSVGVAPTAQAGLDVGYGETFHAYAMPVTAKYVVPTVPIDDMFYGGTPVGAPAGVPVGGFTSGDGVSLMVDNSWGYGSGTTVTHQARTTVNNENDPDNRVTGVSTVIGNTQRADGVVGGTRGLGSPVASGDAAPDAVGDGGDDHELRFNHLEFSFKDRGTIIVAGTTITTLGSLAIADIGTQHMAIIGGTGDFEGASGKMRITAVSGGHQYTFYVRT